MTDLFGRRASLVLASDLEALDLSELRFTFRVSQYDTETPNRCEITVYNVGQDTLNRILGIGPTVAAEFKQVILSAGYSEQGAPFGTIFKGTIKQFKRGRENNVDSYLKIFGADFDLGYNFGTVNKTLDSSSSDPASIVNELGKGFGVEIDPNTKFFGGTLPRGKVLYGLARAYMRDIAATNRGTWFVDNGVLKFVPSTGYLDGDVVVLNSRTGLIGQPEATDDGVHAVCLMNPNIVVGGRVQINNRDINTKFIESQFFPTLSAIEFPASVTEDGVYRVIVAEHEGDSRGLQWYSHLTCLALDSSQGGRVINPTPNT